MPERGQCGIIRRLTFVSSYVIAHNQVALLGGKKLVDLAVEFIPIHG